MLPLSDHNPTSKRAIVVPILIGINVIVFFFWQPFSIGAPSRAQQENQIVFFACHAAIPYEVSHGKTIFNAPPVGPDVEAHNALIAERLVCPHKNVWLSILYSMFLHGSLLHIGGNMLFLWVFGDNIEDRLGRMKFILLYLISGVAATVAQTLVGPSSAAPLIGASGAIAGVLGAYIVLFPRARVRTLVIFFLITIIDIPAVVLLGIWFAMQLLQGVGPAQAGGGVAYMAHVGGFIAGMLLLLILRPHPLQTPADYAPPY
jgi:membrane associated rhomboid family serine protease